MCTIHITLAITIMAIISIIVALVYHWCVNEIVMSSSSLSSASALAARYSEWAVVYERPAGGAPAWAVAEEEDGA